LHGAVADATCKGEEAVVEIGYSGKAKISWRRKDKRAEPTSGATQLWINLDEVEA
jgi:hypothetical protein